MPRYKSYPRVMVLGVMSEENREQEKTFRDMVKTNEKNWYNSFTDIVLQAGDMSYAGREIDKAMMDRGQGAC
jgi:hypothetical protein